MPVLGTRIFDEIDTERVLCITGWLGIGKSRLAFDLAYPYYRRGYRVLANVPHNFVITGSLSPDQLDPAHLYKSWNILDEGGESVRRAKDASLITRSASKADYYVVFAGKRLPHKDLQGMVIEPRFDFYTNYGLPFILWRAKVNSAAKPYSFTFWQYNMRRVHGTFSTRSSSAGIEKFLDRSLATVKLLAQFEGHDAGMATEAGLEGLADDLASGGGL